MPLQSNGITHIKGKTFENGQMGRQSIRKDERYWKHKSQKHIREKGASLLQTTL